MNAAEFNAWLTDYCESFPETGAWLNTFPARDATLRKWHSLFVERGVKLMEAKAATAEMHRGEAEPVKAFEREQTPAKVADLARKIRYERGRVPPAEADQPLCDGSGPVNLGGLFRSLVKMQEEGKTAAEREQWLADQFGAPSIDKRDRVKCTQCLDTGLVRCVGATTTKDLRLIAEGNAPIKQSVAACSCILGDQEIARSEKVSKLRNLRVLPRFNPLEHSRIMPTDAETRKRCAEALQEHKASKRHSQFDAFNNAEFER